MSRSQNTFLIVPAENLLTIGIRAKHKVTDLDVTLANQLDFPIADPTLVALRKVFSLTYQEDRLPANDRVALATIRDLCVNAIVPLGTALRALRLPVADIEDRRQPESQIFKFVFCHREALLRLTGGDSKREGLLEMLDCIPADDLIGCLHQVLALAFGGLNDEHESFDALVEIRQLVALTLAPFNDLLDALDVEPLAVPPRRRIVAFSDLNEDDA